MRFNIPSFSIQFIATKEIKAGEQIFFSYCGKELSAAERKEKLARYGVICQCSACVNATPAKDQLRKECGPTYPRVPQIKQDMDRGLES